MIVTTGVKYNLHSLLFYLRLEIVLGFFISALVYYLYEHQDLNFLSSFGFVPVSLLGTILSVFLAFRNNSSYSRWWEARQLWGDLINSSRMFKAQVLSLVEPTSVLSGDGSSLRLNDSSIDASKKQLILRHVACVNLMRMQLRAGLNWKEVDAFLSEDDLARLKQAINPASELLVMQSESLTGLASQKLLTDFRLMAVMGTVERFYNILGGCERIKNTPFPREYDSFIRVLIWIFIVTLPIYFLSLFAGNISKILIIPLTVGITIIIGFANKAGEILEDPFENRVHDVPMTALCQTIERDLLSDGSKGTSLLPQSETELLDSEHPVELPEEPAPVLW
jgi:ion channel-forming bestrophin family protein